MFKTGIKQKRNVAMIVLAVLTAYALPVTAEFVAPLMDTPLPLPLVESVGAVVSLIGLVVLFWYLNKDI